MPFFSLALAVALAAAPIAAQAGTPQGEALGFSKAFSPAAMGPGSVSMLTFTIASFSEIPVTDMAFSDTLPFGMTLASPAFVSNTCGGTVTAPNGGGTITLAGGALPPFGTCTIVVNVTASEVEGNPYLNVTGDLTSSLGNSGTASAELTVETDRPGFSKSFAPSTVAFGGRSTLTFTIDNSANDSDVFILGFVDNLPAGMVVAAPANSSTDCVQSALIAAPGTSVVALVGLGFQEPPLAAGATCTATVDVIGGAIGLLGNVSGELVTALGQGGLSSGKAAAVLEVTGAQSQLELAKTFTDDPVAPGGTVTLRFAVTNRSRSDSATAITFSDDLDATLSGLTPTLPPTPDPPCGAGSTVSFAGGVLTLTGGNLPPEGVCTFTVALAVPAGTAPGTYPNVAGPVSGDVGGLPETGNTASDLLFVQSFPILTKDFTDDPVGAGSPVTLEFTITNPEQTSSMSDIRFLDPLTDILPPPLSVTLPPTPCGPGSALTLFAIGESQGLSLTGGSLEAAGTQGDSCTFSVVIDIPAGFPAGTYTNTTQVIRGVLDDFPGTPTVTGPPASGDLIVVGAPRLTKLFTDDPVAPGGTVTLEFTLTHDATATADATGIGFTDDLAVTLPGLTAILPPNPDPPCGLGSSLTGSVGDTFLTFAGGTLAPGGSCTFSVALSVPAGAPSGFATNTTSAVTATVGGVAVTGNAATDQLLVTGLLISKEFLDDPVLAGDTVTLRFTLDNTSGTSDATAISFLDSLNASLPGLAAEPPLPDTSACGASSSLSGTTSLLFTMGSVVAGGSCFFDVTVRVPVAAPDGVYNNTTSNPRATIGGVVVVLPPATDALTVESNILALTKEFTNDPVNPGDTVTLEFNLTNLSATETVTDIAFDDDLDAVLSGLEATGATTNTCGGMAAGFPTGFFQYSGGSLLPGASCTIVLDVDVPAGPLPGTVFTNTTSAVSGQVGQLAVTGDPASDDLTVRLVTFSKSFDGPSTATGTAVLSFTLTNLDSANGIGALSFADDLDAVLSGLAAVPPPVPDPPCGAGSSVAGTSFLTLTNGSLAPAGSPGDSCTFAVTVAVPGTAPPGTFLNTTSSLFTAGLPVAESATAFLTIEPPPTFAKVFVPDTILAGAVSTLTFTIDNTASALAADALDFTDNLPAGVAVATTPNASTTCTGGTLTAAAGSGVISYSGGSVAAGASCTVQADVSSSVAAFYLNVSGDLTSTSGNSGPASATLTVEPPPIPGFSKSFAPSTIPVDGLSTLTFTIDNSASALAADALDFTDNLPAGVVVGAPANATTTCGGGTLTAVAGSGVISYTGGSVPAAASCTVQADVTSGAVGTYDNVSGDLTSSAGNSGPATDTLEVIDVVPPQVTLVDSILGTGDGELEECETARTIVSALTVTFDEAMFNPGNDTDPNSVTNPDNWLVVGSGPDLDLSTVACGAPAGDDVAVPILEVTYGAATLTAAVQFDGSLADGPYRLLACSPGLADTSLNPLDGDGDGTGGDSFVRTFRVDAIDAFANGHFDCSLDDWIPVAGGGSTIAHDPAVDMDNANISGSAHLTNAAGSIDLALGQCVDVVGTAVHDFTGFVLVDTPATTLQLQRSCAFFANSGCGMPQLTTQAFFDTLSTDGVWIGFSGTVAVPPTAHSALCSVTLRTAIGAPYEAFLDDLSLDLVQSPILFADGFESGDTSAWSTTVP